MSTSAPSHDSKNAPPPQAELLLQPLQAAGFWAGVGLPFIYVPLVLQGLETKEVQITVAVLLALHVFALVLGRQYNRD